MRDKKKQEKKEQLMKKASETMKYKVTAYMDTVRMQGKGQ
jgi:hypothetical protein